VLEDGHLRVPQGPGLGVSPVPEILDDVTTNTEWISCPGGQLSGP
jgi:O-succinylbenzoate synthase